MHSNWESVNSQPKTDTLKIEKSCRVCVCSGVFTIILHSSGIIKEITVLEVDTVVR